jgi:hypothetical protein
VLDRHDILATPLAIIPGYSHYNLGHGPEVAQVIECFLTQPTWKATQFTA